MLCQVNQKAKSKKPKDPDRAVFPSQQVTAPKDPSNVQLGRLSKGLEG